MWTKQALHQLIDEKLLGRRLIIVANREPYIHQNVGQRIECMLPASGMATALDPIARACGGVWIAHGSGSADRATVDERDHVQVPPDAPAYTLRRLWLTKEQEDDYYYGFSNRGVWPWCHTAFTRPVFDLKHWEAYRQVNELFAQAVLEEADNGPAFVFIQDYHFALLPRMLRNLSPNLIIAQFWHIPWPSPEVFRVCPWGEEILDGLLGNDLLGFHLRCDCQNFLNTVDRSIESKVDQERSEINRGGRATLIRPFPISIDFEADSQAARSDEVFVAMERWRQKLGLSDRLLGIGIDRLDYTKGIPERLQAVDRFLEKYPDYRRRLVFVQISVPSRSHIPEYHSLDKQVERLIRQINEKWSADGWSPIVNLKAHHEQTDMMALHCLSDFCVVSSLHDGMNLVAKEYVASRWDEGGMLILSQFTGAAREFPDALLVNPYAIDQCADAIRQALEMPELERRKRMQRMREAVAGNNVYRWAGKIVSALLRFDFPEND